MIIDDLQSLAKRFNPREAAYFSEFLKKKKVKQRAVYISLFRRIRKQQQYDEKQLINKLDGSRKVQRFSEIKNQLGQFMIESLVLFHMQSSTVIKIHRLTEVSMLLFEKRLYTQAANMLSEARKEAIKFEKHCLLLEIGEHERLLLKKTVSENQLIALNANSLAKNRLFEIMQNEDTFSALNDKVFILYNELSIVTEKDKDKEAELEQLMRNPLLKDISNALSFDSCLKFCYVHALYSRLEGDYKQTLEHRAKAIQLWDANAHMKKEMPVRYREDLSNLLTAKHLVRNYEGFEELIAQIENLKTNTGPEEDSAIFREVYYLRLLYLLNTGEKEKALALIPEIELCLAKHDKFFGQSRLLNFWHNIAITYFVNAKYKEALPWVKKLIASDKKSKVRSDLRDFAQIFEVVLYYETDDSELVEYLLRNARDRLRYNKRLYELDTIVLSSLSTILSVKAEKIKTTEAWKTFLQKLNTLYAKPGMKNLLGLEELILWVSTKIK